MKNAGISNRMLIAVFYPTEHGGKPNQLSNRKITYCLIAVFNVPF